MRVAAVASAVLVEGRTPVLAATMAARGLARALVLATSVAVAADVVEVGR
jgi:hypothetical protein